MLQIAEMVRNHIAMSVVTGAVQDPRVTMVSISYVKMSPDLSLARVYFTYLGDESGRLQALNALKKAKGFLRRGLGPVLGIAHVPELAFFYDESLERALRVTKAIDEAVRSDTPDSDNPTRLDAPSSPPAARDSAELPAE